MELTLRQKTVLDSLVALHHEARQPVHYSTLAQRLGVSRFSAYDMLKVLERKGLVRSEYVLGQNNSGPGRSSVVFYPLAKAREALFHLAGGPVEQNEWAHTQEHILSNVEADAAGDKSLLEDLVAAIPLAISPLAFSAQVLAALFLPVRSRLESLDRDLSAMLDSDEATSAGGGLDLLAGLGLGLSMTTERLSRDLSAKLMEYSRTCQTYVENMDVERRRLLADFMGDLLDALQRGKRIVGH
jgi:hypothetical protein